MHTSAIPKVSSGWEPQSLWVPCIILCVCVGGRHVLPMTQACRVFISVSCRWPLCGAQGNTNEQCNTKSCRTFWSPKIEFNVKPDRAYKIFMAHSWQLAFSPWKATVRNYFLAKTYIIHHPYLFKIWNKYSCEYPCWDTKFNMRFSQKCYKKVSEFYNGLWIFGFAFIQLDSWFTSWQFDLRTVFLFRKDQGMSF